MQNTKIEAPGEYVLFSIPVDMLEECGYQRRKRCSNECSNGKIIINTVSDTEDFYLRQRLRTLSMSEMDCDGDCEACPCYESCDEREAF